MSLGWPGARRDEVHYRHFIISKSLYTAHPETDWVAVHRDYDPPDSRIFYGPGPEALIKEIDNWYEDLS